LCGVGIARNGIGMEPPRGIGRLTAPIRRAAIGSRGTI
jgi:hypothetical protein